MSIIATIGAFIPGLFGKQLSYKVAKTVGIVVLAVALMLVAALAAVLAPRTATANA